MPRATPANLLYTIFERTLISFQDQNEDRNSFILKVIQDYLSELRRLGLIIPSEWELAVAHELFSQVNQMLLKKIYGCTTIEKYKKSRSSTTG